MLRKNAVREEVGQSMGKTRSSWWLPAMRDASNVLTPGMNNSVHWFRPVFVRSKRRQTRATEGSEGLLSSLVHCCPVADAPRLGSCGKDTSRTRSPAISDTRNIPSKAISVARAQPWYPLTAIVIEMRTASGHDKGGLGSDGDSRFQAASSCSAPLSCELSAGHKTYNPHTALVAR